MGSGVLHRHAEVASAEVGSRDVDPEAPKQEDPKSGDTPTTDGKTKDPEEVQEEKLEKEEQSTLGGGLATMATAFTDPRAFLMKMPGMKEFSGGIKMAVDMGPNKGKCLTTGEFKGFGCGDDKDNPKICSCAGLFELCWLPEDPKKVVDTFTR